MDLFSTEKISNILPFDGVANAHGIILSKKECDFYYDYLLNNVPWKNDEAIIFGKKIITDRKVAWYGTKTFNYTYSNITKRAIVFNKQLLALKTLIERESGEVYNSCLLNLYESGSQGMGYHADSEKMLKKHGAIASLSLGATRKFSFKHKENKQRIDTVLENGSLLVMKENTQDYWLHTLPTTKKVTTPRINLTFRTIVI
jgi:alkylated DNA repair dioxygenase AlkB